MQNQETSSTPPLFRSYSSYLRGKYGETTYRIGVDAGFSCPHRSTDGLEGGCFFCDEYGSRSAYQRGGMPIHRASTMPQRLASVREQIEHGAAFLQKRYGADSFILYYQAFSSTFGAIHDLRRLYDHGLAALPFRELVVSTRPDCLDGDIVALLKSYRSETFDVWIELGLQTASDGTLVRINRGHTVSQFESAYNLIRSARLKAAVHLVFGLPGEGMREIMNTVSFISQLHPHGLKIHDLHVPKNSVLFSELCGGELSLATRDRHIEYVISALERLPSDIIMMRFTCDTPDRTRGFPRRVSSKAKIYDELQSRMRRRETWQGRLVNPY